MSRQRDANVLDANKRTWWAKPAAASVGATLTALTMTPFDVIKTRLQTQPIPSQATPSHAKASLSPLLFPRPPQNVCCQPTADQCVRKIHSLAYNGLTQVSWKNRVTPQPQIVCLWDGHIYQNRPVNGFRDAAWQIWRVEGFGGLWKGVGTTLCIAVPSQTIYMLLYDTLLNSVMPSHPVAPLLAGITARATVSTALSPLELLRTRLQSTPANDNIPRTFSNTVDGIRSMVRADGVRSLWRGLSTTLWRDVPFSGIYWMGYESSKSMFRTRGVESPFTAFMGGALSGTCAALLTSPFDVLKTRRQAMIVPGSHTSSTLAIATRIVRDEGYNALFTGLTPRLAKIAPACGIMIACYEGLSGYFNR